MTPSRAIEIIKDELPFEGGVINEALKIVEHAVEKQIPKKPTYVDTRFRYHGRDLSDGLSLDKCYKCPNCNSHIFHIFDSEKYCEYCGQALDWSDTE